MKAISFDFWNTLVVPNPEFRKKQCDLVKEYSGISSEQWLQSKSEFKKEIDVQLLIDTAHKNRYDVYRKLLPELPVGHLNDFIHYSWELFRKYPPILREPETDIISILRDKGIRCYISSNTVFMTGYEMRPFIFDTFGITSQNCYFSDEKNVCKPHPAMFSFPIRPMYHLGDNVDTDGACDINGIKFYHINETQNFKTFLEYANL